MFQRSLVCRVLYQNIDVVFVLKHLVTCVKGLSYPVGCVLYVWYWCNAYKLCSNCDLHHYFVQANVAGLFSGWTFGSYIYSTGARICCNVHQWRPHPKHVACVSQATEQFDELSRLWCYWPKFSCQLTGTQEVGWRNTATTACTVQCWWPT